MAIFRKIVVLGGDSGNGFLKLTLNGNMLTIAVKANVVSNESGDYYLFLIDSDLNMKDYNLGEKGIINKVIQQQNDFNLNDDITAAVVKLSPDYYRRFLIGGNKGNRELFPAIEAYFKSKSIYRVSQNEAAPASRSMSVGQHGAQFEVASGSDHPQGVSAAQNTTITVRSEGDAQTEKKETTDERAYYSAQISEANREKLSSIAAEETALTQTPVKKADADQKTEPKKDDPTEQNIPAKGLPMPKVYQKGSEERGAYVCDDALMHEDTTMGDYLNNELIASENYYERYGVGVPYSDYDLELNGNYIDSMKKRTLQPKPTEDDMKSLIPVGEVKEDERLISDKLAEKVELIESLIDGYGQRGGYYEKIEEQLRRVFNLYEREEQLENSIVDSRWAKVNYGSEGNYYAIGVIYDGNKPSYICYGIPATPGQHAPKQLENYCEFVPVGIGGTGYFMLYQNADTGESIRLK